MFFSNVYVNIDILDVLYIDQGNVNLFNFGRSFNALTFRISSDAILKYNDKVLSAHDGSVAFVPAGLDYIRKADKDECIVIHFNLDNSASQNIDVIYPKDPKKTEALFSKIKKVWKAKAIGYKYKATSLLYEVLTECYVEENKPAENDKINKIRPGIEYIDLNYKNPSVSISEAAKLCFVSEVYFRKIFKQQMGLSPKDYIINRRMQKAINLINSGYYSLKEIAYKCGYTDYKYFSIEFKRNVGYSPSKYTYKFNSKYLKIDNNISPKTISEN